jgi:hypothetical protein
MTKKKKVLSFGTLKNLFLDLFSIEKKNFRTFKNPFVTKSNLFKKNINSQIKKISNLDLSFLRVKISPLSNFSRKT